MTIPNPSSHISAAMLLQRLDGLADVLRQREGAMGLLALGSVGRERQRMDAFSDLDFFVLVQAGHKQRYLTNLDWLASAHPLAWHFQNTVDGHKALMADGVFCEFAVFEPQELTRIPYAPGQWVWRRDDLAPELDHPSVPLPTAQLPDETWIVGEALSCLLVGLLRWHRGEKLSAGRFVQGHALDRLIELDALRYGSGQGADPFNRERRLEQRQPVLAHELAALVPGYAHTPAAALEMLSALERRGAVLSTAAVQRIRQLVADAQSNSCPD